MLKLDIAKWQQWASFIIQLTINQTLPNIFTIGSTFQTLNQHLTIMEFLINIAVLNIV